MSAVHEIKVKLEPVAAAPDSTTVDRQCYAEGDDVLVHDEDGMFIFGTVTLVNPPKEECLIQFGDDTQRWSNFRDLKKVKIQEDAEISCILCRRCQVTPTDEILLCHYCRRGYHQNCHQPPVAKQSTEKGVHWMCSKCVEKRQARERDKLALKKSNGRMDNNNSNSKTMAAVGGSRTDLLYDLSSLKWDANHLTNKERKYCYCGRNGEWCRRMLQCRYCRQWFHDECISVIDEPILLGDRFFLFQCSVCSGGAGERIYRLRDELTLTDIAHLALYNLTVESSKKYHDLDRSIVPFIESKWAYLQPSQEILSTSPTDRRKKILSSFWQMKTRFVSVRDAKKTHSMWGLKMCYPPALPAKLSAKASAVWKAWASGQDVDIAPLEVNPVPYFAVKKLLEPPPAGGGGRKRTRSSIVLTKDPSLGADQSGSRNLRVRQQQQQPEQERPERRRNVYSEESVCDEDGSSEDLKWRRKKKVGSSSSGTPAGGSGSELHNKEPRGTLDLLIPAPDDFRGRNNPFRDMIDSGGVYSRFHNVSRLLVRPLKTHLSEEDIRLARSGKRRRLVRRIKRLQPPPSSSAPALNLSKDVVNCFFHTESSFSLHTQPRVADACSAGAAAAAASSTSSSTAGVFPDPKDSVLSYFGVEERLSWGDKYVVHARRILPRGAVQHLIEWETDAATAAGATSVAVAAAAADAVIEAVVT